MQLIVLLVNATVLDRDATGMKVDGGEACKARKKLINGELDRPEP